MRGAAGAARENLLAAARVLVGEILDGGGRVERDLLVLLAFLPLFRFFLFVFFVLFLLFTRRVIPGTR